MEKRLALLALPLLWLAACSPPVFSGAAPSPLPPVTLRPYASPSPTVQPTRPAARLSTPLPAPTPTPFVYTVTADDTLLGIAARFGVSLDALLTANPEVDPRFLTIGMTLTVPLAEEASAPAGGLLLPLEIGAPQCAPLADASRWCVVEVYNPQEQAAAAVTLEWTYAQGSLVASLPLDILPAGARLPAAAVLPPGTDPPQVSLRSALPWEGEARALPLVALEQEVQPPAVQVRLRGTLSVPAGAPAEAVLLAVGYDSSGQPTALRQAVLPVEGESLAYDLSLSAQRAPISGARVWVLWRFLPSSGSILPHHELAAGAGLTGGLRQ